MNPKITSSGVLEATEQLEHKHLIPSHISGTAHEPIGWSGVVADLQMTSQQPEPIASRNPEHSQLEEEGRHNIITRVADLTLLTKS